MNSRDAQLLYTLKITHTHKFAFFNFIIALNAINIIFKTIIYMTTNDMLIFRRKWLVRNHPDKWHDLTGNEKTTASFTIKEYGHVFQFADKVILSF